MCVDDFHPLMHRYLRFYGYLVLLHIYSYHLFLFHHIELQSQVFYVGFGIKEYQNINFGGGGLPK